MPNAAEPGAVTWRELHTEAEHLIASLPFETAPNEARWIVEQAAGERFDIIADQPATQRRVAHLDAMLGSAGDRRTRAVRDRPLAVSFARPAGRPPGVDPSARDRGRRRARHRRGSSSRNRRAGGRPRHRLRSDRVVPGSGVHGRRGVGDRSRSRCARGGTSELFRPGPTGCCRDDLCRQLVRRAPGRAPWATRRDRQQPAVRGGDGRPSRCGRGVGAGRGAPGGPRRSRRPARDHRSGAASGCCRTASSCARSTLARRAPSPSSATIHGFGRTEIAADLAGRERAMVARG